MRLEDREEALLDLPGRLVVRRLDETAVAVSPMGGDSSSLVVALAVYSMPIGQAGDAALEGAVFGFWPIMWIVINALWIFNMTESSGHFAVLRRTFSSISGVRCPAGPKIPLNSSRCALLDELRE